MSPQELRVIFYFASPGFSHEFSRILSAPGSKINKKLVVQNSNSTVSTCAKSTTMSPSIQDLPLEIQQMIVKHTNAYVPFHVNNCTDLNRWRKFKVYGYHNIATQIYPCLQIVRNNVVLSVDFELGSRVKPHELTEKPFIFKWNTFS